MKQLAIVALDSLDCEYIIGGLSIICSDQEFYSTGKGESRRLSTLVVASDHGTDSNRFQCGLRKLGINDGWICAKDHEFFVFGCSAASAFSGLRTIFRRLGHKCGTAIGASAGSGTVFRFAS